MNAATTNETTETATAKTDSVVDAVFDAALAWIDVGLRHAKTSLDGSAKAMERTAKALDVVRDRITTKQ